ncbi:unnamed protein product [Somion occarium]|uniref:Uncharacterized protein n=1 Tax=Somion occarium TaxID=3059160 RepID=A0ABP1EAZ2_9APHY
MSTYIASHATVNPAKVNLFSKLVATIKNRTSKKSKLRPLRLPAQVAKKEAAKLSQVKKDGFWDLVKKVPETIKEKIAKKKPAKLDTDNKVETPFITDVSIKGVEVSGDVTSADTSPIQVDTLPFSSSCEVAEPVVDLACATREEVIKESGTTLADLDASTKRLEALYAYYFGDLQETDSEASSIASSGPHTPMGSPVIESEGLPPVPTQILITPCKYQEVHDVNFDQIIYGPHSPAWFFGDVEYLDVPGRSYRAPRSKPVVTKVNRSGLGRWSRSSWKDLKSGSSISSLYA